MGMVAGLWPRDFIDLLNHVAKMDWVDFYLQHAAAVPHGLMLSILD